MSRGAYDRKNYKDLLSSTRKIEVPETRPMRETDLTRRDTRNLSTGEEQ